MSKKKSSSNFAAFLKDAREAKGLSQAEVAKHLGYTSPQFISNWERGTAAPPAKILFQLSRLYNVNSELLLGHLMEHMQQMLKSEYLKGQKKNRA